MSRSEDRRSDSRQLKSMGSLWVAASPDLEHHPCVEAACQVVSGVNIFHLGSPRPAILCGFKCGRRLGANPERSIGFFGVLVYFML